MSFEAFSPQVTGLSVTSGVDQMVALHTSNQDDILMCLQRGQLCPKQDRVGELVGTLVDHFTRLVPLEFLLCRQSNRRLQTLAVMMTTMFPNDHNHYLYVYPRQSEQERLRRIICPFRGGEIPSFYLWLLKQSGVRLTGSVCRCSVTPVQTCFITVTVGDQADSSGLFTVLSELKPHFKHSIDP